MAATTTEGVTFSRSPSIYVGDLDTSVSEANLYEHFSKVGPVISVRVCLDSASGKSLGYGYVNFQSPNDAETAIETQNGSLLKDKTIRVCKVQRDPSERKRGANNLFVSNLPAAIPLQMFQAGFANFGPITSVKMNAEKKYGYIMFEKEEDAKKAVAEMQDKGFDEESFSIVETTDEAKKVTVEHYKPENERKEEYQNTFTTMYVGNLKLDVTDEEFNAVFATIGEVASAAVSPDPTVVKPGRVQTKFGRVVMNNHDDAVKVVEELHNKKSDIAHPEVDDGRLEVTRFLSPMERKSMAEAASLKQRLEFSKYPNLYVKNIDENVTDEQLAELFGQAGTTMSVKVQRDPKTHTPRGFGFVSYKEHSAAEKALALFAGSTALGSRPLFVSWAASKEERAATRGGAGARGGYTGRGAGGFQSGGGRGGGRGGFDGPSFGGPGYDMRSGATNYHPMMGGGPMGFGGPMMGGRGGFPGPMGFGGPVGGPMMGAPMGMNGMGGGRGGQFQRPMNQTRPPMNQMQQGGPPQPQPQAPPPQPNPAQNNTQSGGLNAAALAAMPPEQQKNVLGERIYASIVKQQPQQAAKITGMLLEMDNSEILNLLDSPAQLNSKVQEALMVLRAHQVN